MAGQLGSTLKRFILWDYSRATWQYDVMVGIILAFIFLTPREVFRDQPRPKNIILIAAERGEASYWVEPELVTGSSVAEQQKTVEKLIHRQAGGKSLTVSRVEPVYGQEKELRGYIAYTTR